MMTRLVCASTVRRTIGTVSAIFVLAPRAGPLLPLP
jgi:hypothetical protein